MGDLWAKAMSDPAWAAVLVSMIAGAIAVLAIVVSGFSVGYTRSQAAQARRQADAAEAQVALMKEQLAVMETNTTTVIQRGPRLAEWTLRSWGGGRYGLTNDTRNEPLFDVFLRFPEGATCEGVTDWGVFPPGATREFTMTLDPTNPMRLVTVIFKWDPKKSGDDEFSIEVPPEAADRSRTAK